MNLSEVNFSGSSCNCSLENMTKCPSSDNTITSPAGVRIVILAGNLIQSIAY